MGPKKKQPKAKKKAPIILDDVDTTEMTVSKLQLYCTQIHEEIVREKDQAKFFQIEKDKLRAFWEVSRQQLKDVRSQIRSRDKEIDDVLEKRRKDVKISQQKLKHLLHENHNSITEATYFAFLELMEKRDNFDSQVKELLSDINDMKMKILEEDIQQKSHIRALQIERATEVSKVRDGNIKDLELVEVKFDKQLNNTISKLQAEQEFELKELEQRKEQEINNLIIDNKKFIERVKHYYNNLIEHNTNVIACMKESNDAAKNKLATTEKQLREAKLENENLKIPLQKGREEVGRLKEQMELYDHDQQELEACTKTLNKLTAHLANLKWEHEAAALVMQRQQKDRIKSQQSSFVRGLEIQMESSNQTVFLERIIKRILTAIECVYATLETHADLVGGEITDGLKDSCGFLNSVLEDVEYEISVVSKAFHDVLQVYRNKMRAHFIHLDELGFVP